MDLVELSEILRSYVEEEQLPLIVFAKSKDNKVLNVIYGSGSELRAMVSELQKNPQTKEAMAEIFSKDTPVISARDNTNQYLQNGSANRTRKK